MYKNSVNLFLLFLFFRNLGSEVKGSLEMIERPRNTALRLKDKRINSHYYIPTKLKKNFFPFSRFSYPKHTRNTKKPWKKIIVGLFPRVRNEDTKERIYLNPK
jgi:hypothetical protein